MAAPLLEMSREYRRSCALRSATGTTESQSAPQADSSFSVSSRFRGFGPAADVIELAGPTFQGRQGEAPAVVLHVQPVADVESVAVQRNWLSFQEVGQEQGADLFPVIDWSTSDSAPTSTRS